MKQTSSLPIHRSKPVEMTTSLMKRFVTPRIVRVALTVLAIVNILYLSAYLLGVSRSGTRRTKIMWYGRKMAGNAVSDTSGQVEGLPETATVAKHSDVDETNAEQKQLYPVPKGVAYENMKPSEKINEILNRITNDKEKYWLGHTELTDYELRIRVKDFLKQNWENKPTIFYDPRFTLSVYLNEIKNQYLVKNPKNEKSKIHEIVVPFAWSDWVDLTMLNEELVKPENERKTCDYMKAVHHAPARDPNYCLNNEDLTQDELDEMQLPSSFYAPGFSIKKSPTNKASNEVRMWEGKSHLLTYAANPLAVIFLSKEGVYEAKIDGKQRIVDGDLFEHYLQANGYDSAKHGEVQFVMNPVKEFKSLLAKVKPNPMLPEDDLYGMVAKIKDKNPTKSKELYLPQQAFDYQQPNIDEQLKSYDKKLKILWDASTNELKHDQDSIKNNLLSRNEKMYFEGLRYADSFSPRKEETYFRMARLNFGNEENDHDAGWHYEWRFFNGALRYMKQGWNEEELLIREKVLLDRILRNWFRFANEKGIISWIAHGPLLSWYWDGLLFPFDEDIDIQMPAQELTRFAKLYNQTLIVEDITEGFGKYFIDCSSFLHHRGKSWKENHIDARFIDIDTGSYIDITGLGISEEQAPDKYKDLIEESNSRGAPRPVYNCRNLHFYSHEELSPLRFTMMGGVPLYVPNKIEEILNDEYLKGMSVYYYEDFYFVDAVNLWIHESKLDFLFVGQEYKDSFGDTDPEKFSELVKTISEEQVVLLLERDEDILMEYYLTKDMTELHRKELTYLFDMPKGENTLIGEIGHQKTQQEISSNPEYHKFTSELKFQKPFRRSIFNYEKIDKPKHHVA